MHADMVAAMDEPGFQLFPLTLLPLGVSANVKLKDDQTCAFAPMLLTIRSLGTILDIVQLRRPKDLLKNQF